jgi:hypothetical protein
VVKNSKAVHLIESSRAEWRGKDISLEYVDGSCIPDVANCFLYMESKVHGYDSCATPRGLSSVAPHAATGIENLNPLQVALGDRIDVKQKVSFPLFIYFEGKVFPLGAEGCGGLDLLVVELGRIGGGVLAERFWVSTADESPQSSWEESGNSIDDRVLNSTSTRQLPRYDFGFHLRGGVTKGEFSTALWAGQDVDQFRSHVS